MNARILMLGLLALSTSGCQLWGMADALVDKSVARIGLGPNEVVSVGVMAKLSSVPSAVTVDIAFAYGDAAATVLGENSATTWFNEYRGFCRSYANQLDVVRLELPMGYSALLSELPEQHRLAQSIFVFVRDVGKGDITALQTPWVNVADGELELLPAPPGAEASGNVLDAVKGAKTLC
ncbi:MAG: hypothetical protein GWP70_08995 [Proteobacteria bacterium]|nr:hypothetical protein [Pseudomonadota bacterium]